MLRASRTIGVTGAIAAATMLSISPAAATAPKAGASYKGHVTGITSQAITFTVSKHGTFVTKLKLGPSLPSSCGSGGPPPQQSSKPAAIKNGKFTAHIAYSASNGNVFAKATVTGKFLQQGKEKGTVTSVITGAPTCGESLPYTTHAK